MIEQWRAVTQAAQGAAVDDAPMRPRDALLPVAKGVGVCAGVVVLGYVGPLVLNPADALSPFAYASSRPLQVESTPASLLWLGTFLPVPHLPAHFDYSFSSLNYVGPLDAVLKPLSALALVAGCLWVYGRLFRGRLTLAQAFLACLCVVVAANKIFSPQYLLWLLPFVAIVEELDLAWIVLCLLTTLIFPTLYQVFHPFWLLAFKPKYETLLFLGAMALRNAVLVYVTLRAIVRPGSRLLSRRLTPRFLLPPAAQLEAPALWNPRLYAQTRAAVPEVSQWGNSLRTGDDTQ
jgi:hypothetical protein